jgi:hypothetical protein
MAGSSSKLSLMGGSWWWSGGGGGELERLGLGMGAKCGGLRGEAHLFAGSAGEAFVLPKRVFDRDVTENVVHKRIL